MSCNIAPPSAATRFSLSMWRTQSPSGHLREPSPTKIQKMSPTQLPVPTLWPVRPGASRNWKLRRMGAGWHS